MIRGNLREFGQELGTISLGCGERRFGAFSFAAAALGLACASDGFAQQANQPDQLSEITVTATKRSTTLQDTPISITAVTGEDLLDRGVGNFTELAQETPGISMKTSGPGQTEYEMRGLSSNGGSSPTVGFYLDDVPMTPPALGFVGKTVVDPNLYDLNRVEVLRGPQGTLYGAGSMGGTIKLLTNQPDSTGFHASAQTILSDTDGGGFNHTENAMVNLPLITDQLAIRMVGTDSYTSGWIDRIVLNPFPLETNGGATRGNILAAPVQADFKDVNWARLVGGRISALYTPTDRLTVGIMLFDQRITQGGQNNFDSNPGTLAHYEPFNVPEPYSDSFTMWSVNANYKFDGFEVTSVTSHWNRSATTTQDYSEELYSPSFFNLPSYYVADGGAGPASVTENDKTAQLSEELRIASSGDSRLQWLGGLFYSSFFSEDVFTTFVNGLIPLYGTNDVSDIVQPSTISQEAAFGELSYRVLDELKVTVGGRYFQYNSKVTTTETGIASLTGTTTPGTIATAATAHGIDPKFNISYDVDKDLMVYATAERGFRPGGGNQPVPTTGGAYAASCGADLKALGLSKAPESFNPDSLWSYELGEKYKIGSTVTLNGAIYHERWSGVQQGVFLPCGFIYYDNFGTAEVYGGEIEAKAFLTRNWLASVNFGYTHSYFPEGNAQTGTVRGQDMQDIPLATASGALTYFFAVTADWQASVRGSYDWTAGLAEPVDLVASGRLPPHGLANLRATVFNTRWTVAAFVNNLTNKHAEMEVDPELELNIPAFSRLVSNQPLTAGIDVNVKF
jgi:iron complex outermembrane receptor protein